MKIKFDPNLDFQREAIDAIVGLFDGQEINQTNFTVASLKEVDGLFDRMEQSDLGIGNCLRLLDEDIHKNVKAVHNSVPIDGDDGQ